MNRAAALACAALALALVGCGGVSLSLSQLRGNATRACQAAATRAQRIPYPSSGAQTTAFLKNSVPVLSDQLSNLRSLTPPANLASKYQISIGALSEQLHLLQQTVVRLDAGAEPLGAIRALQRQLSSSEARGDAAWRELGIPACATT